jgi:hypothetical protein
VVIFYLKVKLLKTLTDVISQLENERNVPLLFSGKLHDGYCDALLLAEEEKRCLLFLKSLLFYMQHLMKLDLDNTAKFGIFPYMHLSF